MHRSSSPTPSFPRRQPASTRAASPRLTLGLLALLPAVLAVGCASSGNSSSQPRGELATVPEVDLDRFMGDWHVVGLIPNRIEKDPYLSVESYSRRANGKIDITYTFRQGGFEGKEKELHMVARPVDASGSRWRVRPFWPLSLDYRVVDLADDYRYTVIGHPSRNYAWIMARATSLSEEDWQAILDRLEAQGFDPDRIRQVPQERPE